MGRDSYTVIYEKDRIRYKLFKVIFGMDGSYYITSPYHPSQEALLAKMTINYALQEMKIPFEQAVDLASAEDDEKRIKLSHHRSGLIQFSGQGIVSGQDSEGNIRGVGVMSWPLDEPVIGPAFCVAIRGVEEFKQVGRLRDQVCSFSHTEITPVLGASMLALEGYYFPPSWRRFVRSDSDSTKTISIVHPIGAVLKLKVLLAPDNCALPGFIGLDVYSDRPDEPGVVGGFILSSSTGNLRRNEDGQLRVTTFSGGKFPLRISEGF